MVPGLCDLKQRQRNKALLNLQENCHLSNRLIKYIAYKYKLLLTEEKVPSIQR